MLRLGTFLADVLGVLSGSAAKSINNATIGATTPGSATFTTLAFTGSQTAATVLAAPAGAAGAPTFRALALTDLPAAAPKASPSFTGNVTATASNSGGIGSLTVNNPYTAAGTAAALQAVTGTANAYISVAVTDGATPAASIGTGAGVTGGLTLSTAAGNVTIAPQVTLSSATFGASLGAKINLYGTLGAAGSYGIGINSGELTAWTGSYFTLRNSSVTAGLSAPIMLQVASTGSTTINANVSAGNGFLTLSNPNTAAGTLATLQAITGTTGAYAQLTMADGATPTAYILTGTGVTGGLVLNPAALGVTIKDPNASGTQTLTLDANGNVNGANLRFLGNGATTPNKFIRALNGSLSFANSAYTLQIASLTDAGAFSAYQSVSAPLLAAGGAANPYSAQMVWSGAGNGYSAVNTTTGATNTGTNYSSIVSGTSATMLHMGLNYYNGSTYSGVGSITSSTTTTAYNTTSDYRLKTDVQPLLGSRGRIMALKPSSFLFKSDPRRQHHGFLAHEFADAMPDAHAVSGERDGMTHLSRAVVLGDYMLAQDVSHADWVAGLKSKIYPETSAWHEAINLPAYQALDAAKAIPDMVATVQGLVRQVNALSARLTALSAQATVRSVPLPQPLPEVEQEPRA